MTCNTTTVEGVTGDESIANNAERLF